MGFLTRFLDKAGMLWCKKNVFKMKKWYSCSAWKNRWGSQGTVGFSWSKSTCSLNIFVSELKRAMIQWFHAGSKRLFWNIFTRHNQSGKVDIVVIFTRVSKRKRPLIIRGYYYIIHLNKWNQKRKVSHQRCTEQISQIGKWVKWPCNVINRNEIQLK